MTFLIRDLDRFYNFVDGITTPSGVGGDAAEDVFGGLNAMLKLSWKTVNTKVKSNCYASGSIIAASKLVKNPQYIPFLVEYYLAMFHL